MDMADLFGDGNQELVYADQATNQIIMRAPSGERTVLKTAADGVLAPRAILLTDVCRDGEIDLIVLNGNNRVLAFPGLGNGKFGPEVNGGQGFAVGDHPVALAVAAPQDGPPVLAVVDEGSADVRLFFGEHRGDKWTLRAGDTLRTGKDPTAVLVSEGPDGLPNVVVTNHGENTVWVLHGLADGHFDDQHPLILHTGQAPIMSVTGDFTGTGHLDLVTVDYESNDLTYFPDFLSGASVGRSIPSGGEGPVAAIARDFEHHGKTDLVVANSGDDHLAVLLGSANGPEPAATFTEPGLQPTSLASPASPNDGAVYVANNASAPAATITFEGVTPESGPTAAESSAASAPAEMTQADRAPTFAGDADAGAGRPDARELAPLVPGGVGVVPTLVAGDSEHAAAGAGKAPSGPNEVAALLRCLPATLLNKCACEAPEDGPQAPAAEGTNANVARFVQGVDEAVRNSHASGESSGEPFLVVPGGPMPPERETAPTEGAAESGLDGWHGRAEPPRETILDALFAGGIAVLSWRWACMERERDDREWRKENDRPGTGCGGPVVRQ
jgi:hypothetical protein